MKVLITYASAGAGHRRVAEAVYNYLKQNSPDIQLDIIDVLSKTNAFFRFDYTKGYTFLIRHAVNLWAFSFWITEFRLLRPLTRLIAIIINWMNTGRFREFVVNNNPDYIVSTHFMTSEICVHLKNRGKIKSRVVTIITDFGVHPFWITNGTDIYITASEFGKKKLISEKIPEDKIRVFGLPSDDKFLGSFNRKEIALKLGISFDRFTVLLMTGSFGVGPLEEIAKAICNDVQVLLVCAGNKKLFDKMTKINLPNVKVFAFIHNTEELMAVSDIIITKPGGSTISEIINMELVPIFIAAIPGQETGNAQAMKELGIGVYPLGVEEVEVAVLNYKNHPELMEAQKNKLRIMKKPSSCKEIASVIR